MSSLLPLLTLLLVALVVAGVVAVYATRMQTRARRRATGADADRRTRELVLAPTPLVARDNEVVTARVRLTVRQDPEGIGGWREDDVRPLEVLVVATLRAWAEELPATELLAGHHAVADRLQRVVRLAPVGHDVRVVVRLERGMPSTVELGEQRTAVRVVED